MDGHRYITRGRRYLTRERRPYRDAPYRRDRGRYGQDPSCKNCKMPGHIARECPNAAVCNNCLLPGHIAAECVSRTTCWNCKQMGHVSSQCNNEPICHLCNKTGHIARECLESTDPRVCNNCFETGHITVDSSVFLLGKVTAAATSPFSSVRFEKTSRSNRRFGAWCDGAWWMAGQLDEDKCLKPTMEAQKKRREEMNMN